MPIENGKYISPTWQNNGPPALEENELQDITDTLESLSAGGGGSGKRYANLVIGTSTNGWTTADCDYLCDGTDDNVEILAAINDLPAVGGEIVFLSGSYNLSGNFQIPANTPNYFLQMRGSGENTIINGNGNTFSWSNYGGGNNYTSISFKSIAVSSLIFSAVGFGAVSFYDSFLENTGTGSSSYISPSVCNCVIEFTSFNNIPFQNTEFPGEFTPLRFCNNLVYINQNLEASVVYGSKGSVVSGNVFMGKDGASNGAFSLRNGSATGNTLINCGGGASGSSVVSGNTVINGNLSAVGESVLSGNDITDGTITIAEGSTASGNNILQSDDSPNPCITLTKWINNEGDNTYSTITGNTCIGGLTGILLDTPDTMPIKTKTNACITGNTCTATTPLQINSNWSNCLVTGNMFPNGSIVDNGAGNIKANNFTGS